MKRQGLWAACFLAPNLLGFIVFTAGPLFYSLLASATSWNLMEPGRTGFVGLENYSELMHDQRYWQYLANTLYMMIGIPAAIGGSLALAMMLNRKLRLSTAFRTILYLPSFTSGVALMLLWKNLYNPDFGAINESLRSVYRLLGVSGYVPKWLLSTQNLVGLDVEKIAFLPAQFGLGARDALTIMGLWTAVGGGNMLLYLAALTNMPEELVEAAWIDGAGGWASFRHIIWPQLAPTTFFISVMSLIGGMQGGFEQAKVMTNGGPADTTTTVGFYIYSKAFEEFRMGYASAVSWALFAIIFALTLVHWRFGQRSLVE